MESVTRKETQYPDRQACLPRKGESHPDTVYVFDNSFGVLGEGTHLAMPKTILRDGLIVIEAWFRGYLGSPGLGVSGQPDYIHHPDY